MKTTPLHNWHIEQRANMARFGAYHMPMWYASGPKKEHLAVLESAGLFDTSHMAVILLSGTGAFKLLQDTFSNDISACIGPTKKPLSPGRCVYGVFLNEKGWVLDDAIVFQLDMDRYMIVVNAGHGPDIAQHLLENTLSEDSIEIMDLSDRLGKIDLQGPVSAKILSKVLREPAALFTNLPYFSFKGFFEDADFMKSPILLKSGRPVLISRTGYTGEFGFELFAQNDVITALWEELLRVGGEDGLLPCGLAARDSLRVGAVLPLSHQDIGPWPFTNNPWMFALAFDTKDNRFRKRFIGSKAIIQARNGKYTLPFAGYDLRKVSTKHSVGVTDLKGKKLGEVLTCATDMAIDRHNEQIYSINSPGKPDHFVPHGLCCGFVRTSMRLSPGQRVLLDDGRRKFQVEIVKDIRPDRTARFELSKFLN